MEGTKRIAEENVKHPKMALTVLKLSEVYHEYLDEMVRAYEMYGLKNIHGDEILKAVDNLSNLMCCELGRIMAVEADVAIG